MKIRKAIPFSPQTNGAVERQNQGVIKVLSAAKLEKRNWRLSLQDYVHRHNNLIPHSRIRVTPFELMTGWKYRGFFPRFWQNSEEIDQVEVRERDAEAKFSSKTYADSVRGAKESDLSVGDIVLLAQHKRNKTDPTFSSERYRVITREGPKVVVMSKTGVQYTRNIREVKLAPESHFNHESTIDVFEDGGKIEDVAEFPDEVVSHQEASRTSNTTAIATSESSNIIGSRNLRYRETIKRPSRYDEYVFNIFH